MNAAASIPRGAIRRVRQAPFGRRNSLTLPDPERSLGRARTPPWYTPCSRRPEALKAPAARFQSVVQQEVRSALVGLLCFSAFFRLIATTRFTPALARSQCQCALTSFVHARPSMLDGRRTAGRRAQPSNDDRTSAEIPVLQHCGRQTRCIVSWGHTGPPLLRHRLGAPMASGSR